MSSGDDQLLRRQKVMIGYLETEKLPAISYNNEEAEDRIGDEQAVSSNDTSDSDYWNGDRKR